MFSFNHDVGVFEDLEKRVAEPLGKFMKRNERFETFLKKLQGEWGIPSLSESSVDTFQTSPNPLPPSVNFVRPSGQMPRRLIVSTSQRVEIRTTGLPLTLDVLG
jgi:hypothetical protein